MLLMKIYDSKIGKESKDGAGIDGWSYLVFSFYTELDYEILTKAIALWASNDLLP